MQLFPDPAKTHAVFDEEHLVAYGGPGPVMRLAERCGLGELTGEHVAPARRDGVSPAVRIGSIVAGTACGADSIDDPETRPPSGKTVPVEEPDRKMITRIHAVDPG